MRNKMINIRLNEQELKELKDKIKESNYSNIATFLRDLIFKKKIKIFKIKDYSIYKNLIAEINKIGNNINQIARYCNYYKEVDRNVLAELKKINEQLQEILKE